ncbi:hypothetical protein Hanom_Chr00s084911g01796121 [Helianthus anomalus]
MKNVRIVVVFRNGFYSQRSNFVRLDILLIFVSLMFIFWFIQTKLQVNCFDTKVEKSKKQLKERKNMTKMIRGVKKVNC